MRKGNAFLLLAESRDQREKRANLLVFTIRQDSGKEIKERAIPLVFKDTAGPRQGYSKIRA